MKQYKFQALVMLDGDGDPCAQLGSAPRRMVVRGQNEESGRSQMFTALVSCDDEKPFRHGSPRVLATLRLAGDGFDFDVVERGHGVGGVVGFGSVFCCSPLLSGFGTSNLPCGI